MMRPVIVTFMHPHKVQENYLASSPYIPFQTSFGVASLSVVVRTPLLSFCSQQLSSSPPTTLFATDQHLLNSLLHRSVYEH